jgi:drug/metabolite transporter (DMT)-like permease
VSFAAIMATTLAVLFEHPWTVTPDGEAIFSILWLGLLGSGVAYLLVFRLFAHWGATRTTLIAYVIPVVGITLGFLVLAEPIDARILFGTALVVAGVGLVNSRFGRRRPSAGCRRSRPSSFGSDPPRRPTPP